MTDRIKGFYVALEQDLRVDDAEPILEAVRHLRGVESVSASVSNSDDWMNRMRVKHELTQKLWALLVEENP